MTALPEPIAELWQWQQLGLCRTMNPELFFHPEAERGPSRLARIERAKTICAQCPVLPECREHALRVREPYGIWGGLTEEERAALHRAQGRPPRPTPQDPERNELTA